MDSQPSHYQVIARKYRPQTFASVVGQEAIVTTLKNALRFNRLAHAYLFSGCRGTGKTTLARVFAKALNCSRPTEDFEPCNACSSCLDIIAGRSLDVLEIDGASNRGIDDIRQINETIGYAPASGKYKIYIIDEVHMLTKEAFNALLKTLEEPPANVKFFFATTEPHKVLPTIISRCQRYDLNRIPLEALKKKLSWITQELNVVCDEEVISLVANLSEGSLRDAESLLDQIICYAEHPITVGKVSATLGIMPRSTFFSLDEAYNEQNLSFAFDLANEIFSSGKDLSYFIDNLIEHYRCLLKLKLGASSNLPTARLNEQYNASAALYTEEQCVYILDFLIHWQQQIGKTPFKRISLEMILLHIIRSKHRLALPTLIKRLHELEQKLSSPSESAHTHPSSDAKPAPLEQTPAITPIAPVKIEAPTIEPVAIKVAPSPVIDTTPAKTIDAPQEQSLAQTASSDPFSLEETLMKKIREKIESSPAPVQEPEEQEADQHAAASAHSIEDSAISMEKQTAEDLKPAQPVMEAEKPLPELTSKPSSLLLSKAKWEEMARIPNATETQVLGRVGEKETLTTTPSSSVKTEIPEKAASITDAIAAPLIDPPIAKTAEHPVSPPAAQTAAPFIEPVNSSRYDTLMRFAAVELEGTIKKEQPNG